VKAAQDTTDTDLSRYFLMAGLLQAFYWMDEGLQNHLRAAGLPEVTRTQSMIMTNISCGVTRPAELARRLGISRQAVQQLLADMQERKLIVLKPDPDDARAKVVRYNPRGEALGRVTMLALERIDDAIAARLGTRALSELRRVLLAGDWGPPVAAAPKDLEAQRKLPRPPLEVVARHGRKSAGSSKSARKRALTTA
jgi:DNA-binding MarR family transcriptional regulator